MTPDNIPEWTAIFVIYAEPRMDNEKVKELQLMVNDIQRCVRNGTLNESSRLLIIYRRIKGNKMNWDIETTYLFEVVPNVQYEQVKSIFKLLQTDKNVNVLLNGAKLGELFKYIWETFPSKKKLLFTWGHGSIFGIFKKDPEGPESRRRGVPLPSNVGVPGVMEDMLTNEELGEAIQISEQKIDVLIMINCMMQNVITQYALSGVVKYLVAPQGMMGLPGYNYEEILKVVFGPAEYNSPEKVVEVALSTLADKRSDGLDYHLNVSQWSVTAFDLDEIELLTPFLSELSTELSKKISHNNQYRGLLDLKVRRALFSFDNTPQNEVSTVMVDLGLLMYRLKTMDEMSFGGLFDKFQRILKKIRPFKPFIGENIYRGRIPFGPQPPAGNCIYFPAVRKRDTQVYTFKVFVTDKAPLSRSRFFIVSTQWYQFLKDYLLLS